MYTGIYFILSLFFISIAGLVLMIGRKLYLVRNGEVGGGKHFHFFVFDLIRVRQLAKNGVRRYGYIMLVFILRSNVKISNMVKLQFEKAVLNIENMLTRKSRSSSGENQKPAEVSGFLKMVSEYKRKVRRIKNRISTEEDSSI